MGPGRKWLSQGEQRPIRRVRILNLLKEMRLSNSVENKNQKKIKIKKIFF